MLKNGINLVAGLAIFGLIIGASGQPTFMVSSAILLGAVMIASAILSVTPVPHDE